MLICILTCLLGFKATTFFTKIASSLCSPELFGITVLPLCCVLLEKTSEKTYRPVDTQTKYCNPRCTCLPRVNDIITSAMHAEVLSK